MSTTTNNFGFIKPELSDPADITIMNENWDKAEQALNGLQNNMVDYQDAANAQLSALDALTTTFRAISTDGVNYTVSDNRISVYKGMKIKIVPNMDADTRMLNLNVNGTTHMIIVPYIGSYDNKGNQHGKTILDLNEFVAGTCYEVTLGEDYWYLNDAPSKRVVPDGIYDENGYVPSCDYGTDDVEAGSASPYSNGSIYFVIE